MLLWRPLIQQIILGIASINRPFFKEYFSMKCTTNVKFFIEIFSNTAAEVIEIPEQQLQRIKSSSQEVLVNVCDQVVERTSKCLTQRSRPNAAQIITTEELCSMANIGKKKPENH